MNWIKAKLRYLYYAIILRVAFKKKPNKYGTFDMKPNPGFIFETMDMRPDPGFKEAILDIITERTWDDIEEEYMCDHPPFSAPYPKFSDWLMQNYLPPVRKQHHAKRTKKHDMYELIGTIAEYENMGLLNHHIDSFPHGPIDTPDFLSIKLKDKLIEIYETTTKNEYEVIEYKLPYTSTKDRSTKSYTNGPSSVEILMQQIKNAKRFNQ